MKHSLNVAVFGFSLNVLEQLKRQIEQCLPQGTQVTWVNISEQKMDLLLVNDIFFGSTNIQKVIQHQTSAYLRVVKDLDATGQIIGDVLYYPVVQFSFLSEWLQSTFFDYEPYSVNPSSFSSPAVSLIDDIRHVLNEIFIPRNGFIQLYDKEGFIALIDCMTERVWPDQKRKAALSLNVHLNHTYATAQVANDIIKTQRAQDLRTWLWANFANSNVQIEQSIQPLFFKLDAWPQFNSTAVRRDQMKMAASFALGAQIKQVAEQLSLPIVAVEQFVMMADLMHFGHFIDESEAKFLIKSQQHEKSAGQSIRSFFGKLRKKFGL